MKGRMKRTNLMMFIVARIYNFKLKQKGKKKLL